MPEDFGYPLPEVSESAGSVGAHQDYVLSAMLKDFVPDEEVPDIKHVNGKVLCVWGDIIYDDVFGDTHVTKFGQWLTWLANGAVFGIYIPGQNDAD